MISFIKDSRVYVSRIQRFNLRDYVEYALWVGFLFFLTAITLFFLVYASQNQISFPNYAWFIPIGSGILWLSVSVDSIGHKTVYKEALESGESLVHSIIIVFSGLSCIFLCAAAWDRMLWGVPALVFSVLSICFSFIDEWMHWKRYMSGKCDRVEAVAHSGILSGHLLLLAGWWLWLLTGYQGFTETMILLLG